MVKVRYDLPTRCICGSEMYPNYEYVGSYGGAPAYEAQSQTCANCGLTDEALLSEHDRATCETSATCEWCAFLRGDDEKRAEFDKMWKGG